MYGAALIHWFTQQQKIDRLQAENAQLRAQEAAWAKFWMLDSAMMTHELSREGVGYYEAAYCPASNREILARSATPGEAIAALLAKVEEK